MRETQLTPEKDVANHYCDVGYKMINTMVYAMPLAMGAIYAAEHYREKIAHFAENLFSINPPEYANDIVGVVAGLAIVGIWGAFWGNKAFKFKKEFESANKSVDNLKLV